MIVREPPPSRMRELRAKIQVRPRSARRRITLESLQQETDAESRDRAPSEDDLSAEERLAEALRGTFPASDPPSSWAG